MSTADAEITIRRAQSHAEYRACQDAQRRAWGITGEGYLVPVATMIGAQLHGGLVLGAFLPSGEAVGLSFAFLGRVDDRLCLYSQLTGVVPEYQGHGVGAALKRHQWEHARQEGLELLAWVYDPFQVANAHFNLNKLGAYATRYYVDLYGPRTDQLNAGVPTDRLLVLWETAPAGPPVANPDLASLPRIIQVAGTPARPLPSDVQHGLAESQVLLEIPADLRLVQCQDAPAATTWRDAVRAAFQTYFSAGYRAVQLLQSGAGAARQCFYLLTRE